MSITKNYLLSQGMTRGHYRHYQFEGYSYQIVDHSLDQEPFFSYRHIYFKLMQLRISQFLRYAELVGLLYL
jgi:hypothetical protein